MSNKKFTIIKTSYIPKELLVMKEHFEAFKPITIKEIANMLNVAPITLESWIKKNKFPKPYQMVTRGKRFWNKEVITNWIKDRE